MGSPIFGSPHIGGAGTQGCEFLALVHEVSLFLLISYYNIYIYIYIYFFFFFWGGGGGGEGARILRVWDLGPWGSGVHPNT